LGAIPAYRPVYVPRTSLLLQIWTVTPAQPLGEKRKVTIFDPIQNLRVTFRKTALRPTDGRSVTVWRIKNGDMRRGKKEPAETDDT
jgi:hypothetical protein